MFEDKEVLEIEEKTRQIIDQHGKNMISGFEMETRVNEEEITVEIDIKGSDGRKVKWFDKINRKDKDSEKRYYALLENHLRKQLEAMPVDIVFGSIK